MAEYTSHVNGPSTGHVFTNSLEEPAILPPHIAGGNESRNSVDT